MTSDPLDLIETRLHAAGKKVQRRGDRITAQCPAHPDRDPSLSATYGTHRDVVVYCHAGCRPDDILAALNVEWTDFGDHNPREQPLSTWVYKNADGQPLYRVVKYPGKKFRQHAYLPTGEWDTGLGNTDRVPYRLPELLEAIRTGAPIWITEGEKDTDAIVGAGAVATCNSGGAGSFKHSHAEWFRGATDITIIADRDDAGIIHAHDVQRLLAVIGAPARIVQAREGKDAYDHFAFGHAITDFVPYGAPSNEPTAIDWPDPIPLGDGGDRPPFPLETLPAVIAEQAEQVAAEMQLPVDLPAMLAISTLSIAAHGRVTITVQGNWTEPVNTYLVTAMPPSAGKSPAFKAMLLRPIEQWETELITAVIPERDRVETKRKILEKAKSRAMDKGEETEALCIGDELRDLPEIPIPRIIADDITPEKIPAMLAEQNARLALVSTEGGVFQMMTGRYSDKSNLDVYLKAWSGDMLRVDRIGRGETLVKDPALSIGLTVQPDVIRTLSETPELKGRGLTARFMYSLPPDLVGTRDMLRESTWCETIANRYQQHILDIARNTPDDVRLHLQPDARQAFLKWRQSHEDRLAPGGELRVMAEWVTKLQSSTARVAALLHIADRRPHDEPINEATMLRAITIGDYWEAHARLAHDLWGADPVTIQARQILDWLDRDGIEQFVLRDAYRVCRRSISKAADAVAPLALLVDNGWLQTDDGEAVKVGRRGTPSQGFTVHPRLTTLRRPSCPHGDKSLKDPISDLSSSVEKRTEGLPMGHEGHGDMTTSSGITTTPVNNSSSTNPAAELGELF